MTAIDFPNSPSVNDVFTFGSKSWKWTGTVWSLVASSVTDAGTIGGKAITVSSSAPSTPNINDIWIQI